MSRGLPVRAEAEGSKAGVSEKQDDMKGGIRMRPYVICHMTVSIDGKVTGTFLEREECAPAIEEYYRLNREIPAEAFACGRVTMEESFTGGWYPELSRFSEVQMDREDFIADQDAARYAVAFDRHGRLGWKTATIEDDDPGYGGAHIVEVLCESVEDAYLAYLRSIGVSYLFAGTDEMDLETALEKLWSHFFINDLLLEGGSEINGAFERAGLIDELSLVQTSVIADAEAKPLFEKSNQGDYLLKEAKVVSESVLDLRYLKKNNRTYRVIKMSALMEAIELASDMRTFYYDFDKQENVWLSEDSWEWDDEDRETAELIDAEWNRFVRLPGQYELHEYRMMEEFIEDLGDRKIQAELSRAIQGRGAFRRFKAKLLEKGIEQNWYTFRDTSYRQFALRWCEENGIRCERDI